MSKLYIVPTPIGNLKDITFRAIETLKSVDFILTEDTRQSSKLLKHYDIDKKMIPYNVVNEDKINEKIIKLIKNSGKVALISDAGTPGISDPGYLLIKSCIKENIDIECLPGPSAFIPALVMSGLPMNNFVFEGFLPHKKGRKKKLELLSKEKRTIILYESPHRINKLLNEIYKYFGKDRRISVSREISKKFEETLRAKVSEIIDLFKNKTVKGEFVVIIEGKRSNRKQKDEQE